MIRMKSHLFFSKWLFSVKKGVILIVKIKCMKCGHTLLFAEYIKGEIKCSRCKAVNKVEYNTKGRVQRRTLE